MENSLNNDILIPQKEKISPTVYDPILTKNFVIKPILDHIINNTFVESNRRIKNITEEDSSEISGECPICYESMIIGNISQLNCGVLNKQGDGHWFHTACIVPWIEDFNRRDKKRCPVCRVGTKIICDIIDETGGMPVSETLYLCNFGVQRENIMAQNELMAIREEIVQMNTPEEQIIPEENNIQLAPFDRVVRRMRRKVNVRRVVSQNYAPSPGPRIETRNSSERSLFRTRRLGITRQNSVNGIVVSRNRSGCIIL